MIKEFLLLESGNHAHKFAASLVGERYFVVNGVFGYYGLL